MDTSKRPTLELKTVHGHVVVLKEYATGRESNQIQALYLESVKMTVVGGVPQINDFDVSAEEKVVKKMIELLVVSVNGSTENIVDAVLDLQATDYNEIIEKLNEVTGKKKVSDTSKQ